MQVEFLLCHISWDEVGWNDSVRYLLGPRDECEVQEQPIKEEGFVYLIVCTYVCWVFMGSCRRVHGGSMDSETVKVV